MFDTGPALCIVILVTLDTGPALCIDTSNWVSLSEKSFTINNTTITSHADVKNVQEKLKTDKIYKPEIIV